MFRFSPMKCFVLVWALNAMGVAATEPALRTSQARELDSDHRINQVRELLRSSPQLQGEDCIKTSKALDSEEIKLLDQTASALDRCTTFPCTIDYKSLSAYNSYRSACSKRCFGHIQNYPLLQRFHYL
jgi:hypothetical protein